MAERVFLHIGLPKTATTYLQTVLWASQDQLRADGVLLPGKLRREHLWASRVVREEPWVPLQSLRQQTAWDRLRAEIREWPCTALLSHEFFAAASADQARRMIAELAPAEVHLIATAREPLGLFAASWQESLKNKESAPLSEYARDVSEETTAIWNWRTLDLRLVLERWAPPEGLVPAERVHVLPLPQRDAGRDAIWHRFAGVIGLDGSAYDLSGNFANTSMGVVEAETLRRINPLLETFTEAIDKGTFIRTFLADERLVTRGGERFWPDQDQVEDCRRRGTEALAYVAERGFDVVGEIKDLLVPDELEPRRHPDSVTDAEVAEVAVALVARMLDDVRTLRHERRALREQRRDLERQAAHLQALVDRSTWEVAKSRFWAHLGRE